ncbi:uncharacterized protein BDR25DRAFT_300578 [Lindgomyces ingoldianus]|uniref:Uncharacterized protein n=1 Tax=Lindgomyces ingoldianus TaxID=673940 RepID=A0ACB6RBP6_9PLEO|nr:uncharacterized protein BDR25DRAFT_300578 [Lindgomyces ingoldianus]KAF2476664.1 hypothetical protein BDR25DRAFT_300578 [Lindgomyces ingoldianus]
MSPRAPAHLRTLLRTSTLLQPAASQLTRNIPHSQVQVQRRSPSPSSQSQTPFQRQTRQVSITTTPRGAQWTRFTTPYSLSSIRTFSASRVQWRPSEEVGGAASDPQAAKRIEELIEEIRELYGTARDEFEIAAEETEKNTTYAPDDREAAREELDKLLGFYNEIIEGEDKAIAEEVKRRVGQRIRELENAVLAMEEAAKAGD